MTLRHDEFTEDDWTDFILQYATDLSEPRIARFFARCILSATNEARVFALEDAKQAAVNAISALKGLPN